jgi:bifunctional non-homologous end joining protein LigD
MAEFVIHQHHARSLHWDLRLERDGVLVCWAVPRGVPRDPARNHLAVHTPDHPIEFLEYSGDIPAGEYGGGRMRVYDRGAYTVEKWLDDEVVLNLFGQRVTGKYVLFQTRGKDWMMHRMDPPEPGYRPMPRDVRPMRAVCAARLPSDDAAWAYELDWIGTRALVAVSGGRVEVRGTDAPREVRALGPALAPTECLLDGVLVEVGDSTQYFAFDLLWLDGRQTTTLPYEQRRDLLLALEIAGPHWQTPPHFVSGGRFALDTAKEQGLPGVVAKRLTSSYSDDVSKRRDWRKIAVATRARGRGP